MAFTRAVGKPGIYSRWSASGGQLVFARENASVGVTWGVDGSGIDTTWYGETAGANAHWIVSSDTMQFSTGATLAAAGAASFAGAVAFTSSVAITGAASFAGVVSFTGSTNAIGNASTDKIGFYGATATIQQSYVSTGQGIADALINLGLMASA